MIAQLRHHPSIIAWSVANEYRTNSIVSHAYLKRFIGDLVGEARRLDPSRAVAAATCRSYLSEVNSLPDVLGFNFYPGWYRRTADEMRQTIDAALAETPRRTIAVTEYGAGGNTTCHEMAPVRNKPLCAFHSEEYQAWVHHGNYLSLAFDPRVWGTFSWLMYDFGADARREGARFGLNDKGLVTYDRQTRKDAFYFYQVNWQARERLYLVGQRLSATTNATGCVMAFWNGSGPVSLTVNGRDFPPRTPDPVRTVIWEDVPLKPGKNVISVSAGPFVEQAVWRLDS
jgi:beta-galactosidase